MKILIVSKYSEIISDLNIHGNEKRGGLDKYWNANMNNLLTPHNKLANFFKEYLSPIGLICEVDRVTTYTSREQDSTFLRASFDGICASSGDFITTNFIIITEKGKKYSFLWSKFFWGEKNTLVFTVVLWIVTFFQHFSIHHYGSGDSEWTFVSTLLNYRKKPYNHLYPSTLPPSPQKKWFSEIVLNA